MAKTGLFGFGYINEGIFYGKLGDLLGRDVTAQDKQHVHHFVQQELDRGCIEYYTCDKQGGIAVSKAAPQSTREIGRQGGQHRPDGHQGPGDLGLCLPASGAEVVRGLRGRAAHGVRHPFGLPHRLPQLQELPRGERFHLRHPRGSPSRRAVGLSPQ